MKNSAFGLALVLGLSAAYPAFSATFAVTNANDSGGGSLRQAILDANATSGADVITFSLASPYTIAPLSPLPNITDPVTIDGTTQPGYGGLPLVVLSGASAGAAVSGLVFAATPTSSAGSVLKSIVVNGFTADGVDVYASSVTVNGCWIGLDATGSAAAGNGSWGLYVGASSATISNNVISGNAGLGFTGLQIAVGSGTVVKGNIIGLDRTGSFAVPNGTGVGTGVAVSNLLIGGTTPADRNVISGNGAMGLDLNGPATLQGNYIGTNSGGGAAVGNTLQGVLVRDTAPGTVIGGVAPGSANVISGNGGAGVEIDGANVTMQGNVVGMDPTASAFLYNGGSMVFLNLPAASNVLVGGTAPGAGNLLAGASVWVSGGSGASILGNLYPVNGSIQLGAGGAANDACDADTGPNDLQNVPTVSSAIASGGNTLVSGLYNSVASTSYRIEFYRRTAIGYTPTYLGSTVVTTDGGCGGSFSSVSVGPVPVGEFVVATATPITAGPTGFGSTSEFSPPTGVATPVELQRFSAN